ncbi:MAG: hypothetical protein AABZ06_07805 [Bdellovibrionota bacterium]
MSVPNKSKSGLAMVNTPNISKAEAQDEINKIMSEIEHLQKEMNLSHAAQQPAGAAGVKPAANVSPLRPPPRVAPQNIPDETPDGTEDVLNEFRGTAEDGSMEETLGGLEEIKSDKPSILDDEVDAAPKEYQEEYQEPETNKGEVMPVNNTQAYYKDNDSEDKNANANAADSSLTMTLTGNMSLNLKYDCCGEEIVIGFRDDALRLKLSDGAEFKIPLRRKNLRLVK